MHKKCVFAFNYNVLPSSPSQSYMFLFQRVTSDTMKYINFMSISIIISQSFCLFHKTYSVCHTSPFQFFSHISLMFSFAYELCNFISHSLHLSLPVFYLVCSKSSWEILIDIISFFSLKLSSSFLDSHSSAVTITAR